jgi:hypothetical protein
MENTLPDQPMPGLHDEGDTTRATARLSGLDIEIVHRRAANAEHIFVHLRAMPSFDAFGRFLEGANPFAFWAEAAQLMWLPFLPWFGATRTLAAPRRLEEAPPTSPEA